MVLLELTTITSFLLYTRFSIKTIEIPEKLKHIKDEIKHYIVFMNE